MTSTRATATTAFKRSEKGHRGLAWISLWAGLAGLAAAGGCSIEPSVANQPTYEADVKPILVARCVRCHGDPPLGEPPAGSTTPLAPIPGFRFDVYDCLPNDATPGNCAQGAKTLAGLMKQRVKDLGVDAPGHMPPKPAPALSAYQVDTIAAWAAEMPPLEK